MDMSDLLDHVAKTHGVVGFKGADSIANENFWDVKTDVLIPAALEGQISAERAQRIHTRLVLEGANGPTTPDGDAVLAERGIIVVPDVIANAGGVTVSYFEWVQDFSSFFWTEDEINVRLDKIMIGAFKGIWETSEQHRIPLRTAAFTVACTRVLEARVQRGLYP
jgi:glutamate dehydrogenase (NAD(P)+)